jgi:hypothetical protein
VEERETAESGLSRPRRVVACDTLRDRELSDGPPRVVGTVLLATPLVVANFTGSQAGAQGPCQTPV